MDAKQKAVPSQTTDSPSTQQRFEGWEFWDERYSVPPAMLTKTTCGKLCEGSPELTSLLPETVPPNRELFGRNLSCALVASSNGLDAYEFGPEIDAHDIVVRFNLRDPKDPKRHGSKTTHMIVHCGFWNPNEPQYRKLYLIRNRTENVILFYARMHHLFQKTKTIPDGTIQKELFPKYTAFLKERHARLNKTYILDHRFVWRSREAFQDGSGRKLKFYPSSGFNGMFLMSRACARLTAFGFTDSELKKDYKFLKKASFPTHDFEGEHLALHRWRQYTNPTVKLTMKP